MPNVWEQRKLDDVLKRRIEQRQQSEEYPRLAFASGQGVIPLSERKTNNREQLTKDEYTKKYLVTELNDIVYNPANVKYGAIDRNKCGRGVISPIYVTFTTNEVPGFIERIVTSHDFQQRALRFEEGTVTKRQSVNPEDLVTLDILVAPKREEQQKIATYFDALDHLITLHHRKYMKNIDLSLFAWEQRKLSDVVDSVDTGKSRFDKEGSSGEYPILGSTSVIGYDDEYDYEGDFILTARVGANAGSLYRHAGKVKISDNTVFIQASQNIEFLYQLLIQFDIKKLSFGTGQPLVKASELKSLELMMPSDMKEQMRIGEYLKNLDHLITLHQRKCEEMKTLKKYMLQKMFPQNGQSVPQIRFSGFTEDWEQRKLGDLVNRVTRKNQDLVSELPLTISAQYGLIDQNEFFDKRVASKDVSGYYLIENGEFAYNKSTSTDAPWGAIKRLDRYENGVLSTLYIIFGIKENNPVDSDFLVSYYSTNLWHKGIHEIAAEGARNHGLLNIAPADFFETKLMIPQDIEEQKKIGKYFEELERLITLHQQKCDELRNIKKFMLQNMFI